jgi:tetratricopeptide (TPR) repeat protein
LEVFFASRVLERLGWDEASKVYKYVNDKELGSSYWSWITNGLALMADEKQDFAYRKHIAEDVAKLIREGGDGDEQWEAGYWGQYYLKHPLRDDKDSSWLEQAAKWRKINVLDLRRSACLGPHELCELADVYRQLGNFDDAARLYTEALALDLSDCCENTSAQSIEERLAVCRSVDLEK